MRDLTTTELNAVSGGLIERPRITFSVKLSAKDQRALAVAIKLFGSLTRPQK